MAHHLHIVLVLLAAAVIMVPIARLLKVGAVIGYLAGGLLVGPFALGLIETPAEVVAVSELGVVMLLFLLGLELSPRRLWLLRRSVFGVGAVQVFASMLPLALLGLWWGLTLPVALIAAFALSLSSTAFVLQILSERREMPTEHGRAAFGVLLFQDLLAVPVLALIPLMANDGDFALDWIAIGKVVSAIAAVMIAGRFAFRPIFGLVARANSAEVFSAAALLVVLGTASLMHEVGLSMGLGAFLAGVLLAESRYRHELEAHIEPFKGLLLGLFFIGVGMTIDLRLLAAEPQQVVLILLVFVAVKVVILFWLARRQKLAASGTVLFTALLAPAGEFAFVVFQQAQLSGAMASEPAQLLTLSAALSMVLTPFMVMAAQAYSRRAKASDQRPYDQIDEEQAQIVIAGFGRVGQIVGRVLNAQRTCFVALDTSPEQVDLSRRFGHRIFYGDPSRAELLRAAKTGGAELFVLSVADPEVSVRIARVVRREYPNLPILARARNRQHAFALMELGITKVFRETLDTSLRMTHLVLEEIGLSTQEASERVERFRKADEDLLLQQHELRGDEVRLIQTTLQAREELAELFEADRRRRAARKESKK